ncbi:MAG TPA: acetyl-CoA carboxylase biotin carboxyl carrier protein [Vicinamibacterales bacterium]
MDFSDIEQILGLMREHDLAEFELERDGLKLRVRKGGPSPTFHATPMHMMPVPAPQAPPAAAAAPAPPASLAAPAAAADAETESVELAVVKSPIVGTFYRCPEPGAPAFVEIGERVTKDQVLCIIEAMKLMNEITSEYDGEVTSAYVENGKPVQYGERLFAIKTA